MIAVIERLTGLERKGQGTVFLVGLGHGGTHWIAATFYLLLPFITRDLGLSYAEAGLLVAVFHLSAFAANFGSGLVVDVTGRRVVYQVASLAIGAAALLGTGGGAAFPLPSPAHQGCRWPAVVSCCPRAGGSLSVILTGYSWAYARFVSGVHVPGKSRTIFV